MAKELFVLIGIGGLLLLNNSNPALAVKDLGQLSWSAVGLILIAISVWGIFHED